MTAVPGAPGSLRRRRSSSASRGAKAGGTLTPILWFVERFMTAAGAPKPIVRTYPCENHAANRHDRECPNNRECVSAVPGRGTFSASFSDSVTSSVTSHWQQNSFKKRADEFLHAAPS